MSDYTKHLRTKLFFCRLFALLFLVAPLIVYGIIAFSESAKNYEKIILVGCIGLAVIIEMFSLFFRTHKRSPIWLVLIGICLIIKAKVFPLICVLGGVCILDDFVFTPLIDYYKTALISSKTLDKREKYEKGKNIPIEEKRGVESE